ncbi:MAG: DEAD/DEAH box helicase, partial [Candidatus Hodarchaeota archaeon]
MNRFKIKYEVKTKPYPHQIEATRFILENDYCAIFDEQGLGKTKIVIDAIVTELKQKKINGCLVVSPKTLIKNWENEVTKHSYLKPLNLIGTKKEKGYKFLSYANIYLTNYEQVISELERIKDFLKINNFAIVLDESQRIKNPKAKTTKAILELCKLSNKKIIITGTPIANKPEDIWAQCYFLDEGKLLGKSFNHFKDKYIYGEVDENSYLKLREKISSISLRRLKVDVLELPEKIYKDIYVELNGLQKEKYEKLKESLIVEIKNFEGEIIIDENDYFIKKLLRLTQLASHPFLLDKSYNEIPSRISALDELVNEIISRGEKAIIWISFVDNIRLIRNRYRNYGSLYLFGEIPIDDRN